MALKHMNPNSHKLEQHQVSVIKQNCLNEEQCKLSNKIMSMHEIKTEYNVQLTHTHPPLFLLSVITN
jgi:hypothetical protein